MYVGPVVYGDSNLFTPIPNPSEDSEVRYYKVHCPVPKKKVKVHASSASITSIT